jgi:hypothetical protein
MVKKYAIPTVNSPDQNVNTALAAIKMNIEVINGSRPGYSPLPLISSYASLSEVIVAVNKIIARLNFDGE